MTLWSEIGEQPGVVERLVASRTAVARVGDALTTADFTHVVIAARGTSDNAARYAQYVWGARNGLTVALAAPSLFTVYRVPPRLDGALIVAISQSGQSPDLIEVLAEARRQGRPTLAITNEATSPLAAVADLVLETDAGPERSVAATKTYTAQLTCIALLSHGWRPSQDAELQALPKAVSAVLDAEDALRPHVAGLQRADRAAVLGRGFHHSTAFEWALKLQELTHVLAHPFSTADFLHGPVALVEDGFPLLMVDTAASREAAGLLSDLTRRGAATTVLSDDPAVLGEAAYPVRLPAGTPEWLSPIPAAVAAQIYTYHLAHARGLDPDSPRGIQKVTRTT